MNDKFDCETARPASSPSLPIPGCTLAHSLAYYPHFQRYLCTISRGQQGEDAESPAVRRAHESLFAIKS